MLKMVSIELTNRCSKNCPFCYNHSRSNGEIRWEPEEVIQFALDCHKHGVEAFSLGGGEPLEYDGLFNVIEGIKDELYVTITSNGLLLEHDSFFEEFSHHLPDKIHLSLHNPENQDELDRILSTIHKLEALPVKSGVNLLISSKNVTEATAAYRRLLSEGIGPDRIIVLPMKYQDMPSMEDLKKVISMGKFQAPGCLLGCRRPKEFCSVTWDKKAHPCSYSSDKVALETLDFEGLTRALERVCFRPCLL